METIANTEGDNNIIVQGVTNSSITVNVNGQTLEIEKKLDALLSLMEKMTAKSVQTADKIYNIGTITNANFGYLVNQAGWEKSLPAELSENLVGEDKGWIKCLRHELQVKQRIPVGNRPGNIFQYYGWLVETFLRKMATAEGQKKNLRSLSFMAEAWHSSLRYLCFIQIAQILEMKDNPKLGIVSDFLQMEGNQYLHFDYTSLLLTATECVGEQGFLKEIKKFTEEMTDSGSVLYGASLYLEDLRNKLINNEIAEDSNLPGLLDEYLTALVYWLRKISFLCKYRLVSIKEINLDYRLGTPKNFVHLYGELHGLYDEGNLLEEISKSIEDFFTYNKSVLLFRGTDVSAGMEKIGDQAEYLSLSPLVIDQSVYAVKPVQTPEIFYFTGIDKVKRLYKFSHYQNELAFGSKGEIASNKFLSVKAQNTEKPRLDELYEQLETILKPLKIKHE